MEATDGGPGSSEGPQGQRTAEEAAEPQTAGVLAQPETVAAPGLAQPETSGGVPETGAAGGLAPETGRSPALRAEVWGAAPWERIAADAAEIHDDLVGRLGRPGW